MARAPLGSVKNVEGRRPTVSLEGVADRIAMVTIKTRHSAEATAAARQFVRAVLIERPHPPALPPASADAPLAGDRTRCARRSLVRRPPSLRRASRTRHRLPGTRAGSPYWSSTGRTSPDSCGRAQTGEFDA